MVAFICSVHGVVICTKCIHMTIAMMRCLHEPYPFLCVLLFQLWSVMLFPSLKNWFKIWSVCVVQRFCSLFMFMFPSSHSMIYLSLSLFRSYARLHNSFFSLWFGFPCHLFRVVVNTIQNKNLILASLFSFASIFNLLC